MLISPYILQKFSPLLGAMIVTIVPYTPFNLSVFVFTFILVYFTNLFGLGTADSYSCKYNKLESETKTSLWTSIKNSYYIYFIVAFIINYNTIFTYQKQSIAIHSV